MKKIFGLFSSIYLAGSLGHAATVLQVKGASAIIEMSAAEIQSVKPKAGQQIILLFGTKQASATIKKISNKKALITSTVNLTGQKAVALRAAGGSQSGASVKSSSNSRSDGGSRKLKNQKDWLIGGNFKYATGSANITIVGLPNQTVKYTGFDVSGTGIYYFGDIGVGLEGEYAMLTGSSSAATNKLTQVNFNLIGEYKIKALSVGALFTVFSNISDTDSIGNANSLNGTGYGAFATYTVMPQVRIILDYKMASYKLEPATYTSSDIRLGAGYYF